MNRFVLSAVLALAVFVGSAQAQTSACDTAPLLVETTCNIPADPPEGQLTICQIPGSYCDQCETYNFPAGHKCSFFYNEYALVEEDWRTEESPCCYIRTVQQACVWVEDCVDSAKGCGSTGLPAAPCGYSIIPPFSLVCGFTYPQPCSVCCSATTTGIPTLWTYEAWALDSQCPWSSGSCYQ